MTRRNKKNLTLCCVLQHYASFCNPAKENKTVQKMRRNILLFHYFKQLTLHR